MIRRDEIEGRYRCLEIFAGRNRRNVCHDTGKSSLDKSVRELPRRFVALRYGIAVARILFHRAGRIVVKTGRNGIKLLRQGDKLLLRILQVSASSIEGRLRRDVRGQQILLTVEFGVEITDVVLCLLDL